MNPSDSIVEKLLSAVGLSTTQVRWRYYRQRDALARWFAARKQTRARHKFCHRCGLVAPAAETICPQCRKALPSYLGSKLYRAFALNRGGSTVSFGFIGLVVLLFCLQLSMTRFQGLLSPSGEALTLFGAFSTALAQDGEYWRALTMGLEHIGVIHLIFNLMAISQTLGAFEVEIGPWRALTLITATQLGAVAAHVLLHDPSTLTAGASGIAFGLIGFGVAYAHAKRNFALRRFFLQWFAYGLVFGFFVGANNAAHLGGFLTGLPLGYLAANMREKHRSLWQVAGIGCLAAWLIALGFLATNVIRHRSDLDSPSRDACLAPANRLGRTMAPSQASAIAQLR